MGMNKVFSIFITALFLTTLSIPVVESQTEHNWIITYNGTLRQNFQMASSNEGFLFPNPIQTYEIPLINGTVYFSFAFHDEKEDARSYPFIGADTTCDEWIINITHDRNPNISYNYSGDNCVNADNIPRWVFHPMANNFPQVPFQATSYRWTGTNYSLNQTWLNYSCGCEGNLIVKIQHNTISNSNFIANWIDRLSTEQYTMGYVRLEIKNITADRL